MKIVFRGNFGVDFSTESHVAWSLEDLGHEVIRVQESEVDWTTTIYHCRDADLFLWTSTWGYAHRWDQDVARDAVQTLNDMLPTAAFHLDLFWSLPRADQPTQEPWFRLHHVFTADGGHDELWKQAGVNHHWSPPGVFGRECYDGIRSRPYYSDIAFVGSWQGHYHPESHHRFQLVDFLQRHYPRRVAFWPRANSRAVRGRALNNLYASSQIVIGDSCMVPSLSAYWSDRIPETTGRGGFLLHPSVPKLDEAHPDLITWQAFDWDELRDLIEYYLSHPHEREDARRGAAEDTRARHTYAHRMQRLIRLVIDGVDEGPYPVRQTAEA